MHNSLSQPRCNRRVVGRNFLLKLFSDSKGTTGARARVIIHTIPTNLTLFEYDNLTTDCTY